MQPFIQQTSGRVSAVSGGPATIPRMRTTFRRTAVIFLTALLSVVTLGALPAHAVVVSLELRSGCVSAGTTFDYALRVRYTLTQDYPGGASLLLRFWGDDPSSDDLILGPIVYGLPPGDDNGFRDTCVNSGTLDEDWGEDEIYAGVRVYDAFTGVQREVAETNRIRGSF
jgi:hypothetical protein